MTTIKSESGKKAVNIRFNAAQNNYSAAYVQIDNNNQREQLITLKIFSTEKNAINWANKQLA